MRALLVVALAACGGSSPPPPRDTPPLPPTADERASGESDVARLTRVRDRACACQDVVCLEDVDREWAAHVDAAKTPDDDDLTNEIDECFGALGVQPVATVNRRMLRQLDDAAAQACACADDTCRVAVRDSLVAFEEVEVYAVADADTINRIRASVSKLGTCLDPVMADVRAQVIAELEVIRADACACTDAACGKRVSDAFLAWASSQAMSTLAAMPHADVVAVQQAMAACLQAAR